MNYTYEQIKKEYEIVYEKELDKTGITEEQAAFGDMPKRVLVVKIDHISKYMVYANYHGDEWSVNSGERFVIGELLKEKTCNKLREISHTSWGITLEKSMFHEYTFKMNTFRDNIIFTAITEALPEFTDLIQACRSRDKVTIVEQFKKNNLFIKIFNNLHSDHFSCDSIGCIYQNDLPIHFFDYL